MPRMQEEINKIVTWADTWKMSMNTSKTKTKTKNNTENNNCIPPLDESTVAECALAPPRQAEWLAVGVLDFTFRSNPNLPDCHECDCWGPHTLPGLGRLNRREPARTDYTMPGLGGGRFACQATIAIIRLVPPKFENPMWMPLSKWWVRPRPQIQPGRI